MFTCTARADLNETTASFVPHLPQRVEPLGAEPPPPFGLEYEHLRVQVARVTARILADNRAGQVLVIAHGGTLATRKTCRRARLPIGAKCRIIDPRLDLFTRCGARS